MMRFVTRLAKAVFWLCKLPFRLTWFLLGVICDWIISDGFAGTFGTLGWVIFAILSFLGSLLFEDPSDARSVFVALPWVVLGLIMFLWNESCNYEERIHFLFFAVAVQSIMFAVVGASVFTPLQKEAGWELFKIYCQITWPMAAIGEILLALINWRERPQPRTAQYVT